VGAGDRVGDFAQDRLRGLSWVGGLGDGTANDEQGSAVADRFGRRGDSLLISYGASGRTNSGNDEKRLWAGFSSEDGDLFRGADDAVDAGSLCELGETEDLFGGRCGDAYAGELACIHAGEDSDCEQARRTRVGCGFGCSSHHGFAAAGVDCEQGSSGFCGGADSSGDGVGDVMEFEVEEDAEAAIAECLYDLVSCRVVELHADLVPVAGLTEAVYELHCFMFAGKIESYGEAVFWGVHSFSLTVLVRSFPVVFNLLNWLCLLDGEDLGCWLIAKGESMQVRKTLLRLFVLSLFSVGYAAVPPSPQTPQTRPAPGGQPGRPQQPGGGGKPNPGGGNNRPNPGGQKPGNPQIQPVRPNPGNGNNRPQPGRPNPGKPTIQPVRPNPGGGNRPNPPRPNPRPPVRPPNRPGRPPSWGRPPASRPTYGWRPNDRAWLHRYYARSLLSINLSNRPVFSVGGFFPYAYIPYITPVPPAVYSYLPPPPPGYEMGYYDGYVMVYDPVTYFIANVIDLMQQ